MVAAGVGLSVAQSESTRLMFYQNVPRDFAGNIAYRVALRERCVADADFRAAMTVACRADVLFFFSAFCWLFEPRPRFTKSGKRLPKMIPFIPWEHQEEPIRKLRETLGLDDMVVYKSRGEGLSWIAVLLALHDWLFDDMSKVGLVSNTEKKADDPGNMDSLMAKVDWELAKLPPWMAGEKDTHWKRNLADHSLVNLRNGSQINAFAATSDAGRSGRYKWFLADELGFWDRGKDREFMEAIRESTESRLAISTPAGSTGAFYDMVHVPSSTVRIRVHWSDNEYKNRGLYRMVSNSPVAEAGHVLDPEYDRPSQRVLDLFSRLRAKGFRLDGGARSPWYDKQCDRADATPQSIAQELDLDFGGSMFRVFTTGFFDKANASIMPPLHRGRLSYHPQTLEPEFIQEPNGEFKLWCPLDLHGNPPRRRYAIGLDIGSGLGGSHTSNSACEVVDLVDMAQVAEFAINTMDPSEFGELCVAVAKWFYDAYLGWEANFGGGLTKRVIDIGYANIYYRTTHWRQSKKKQREVGWWTDDRTKELLFSDLLRMTKTGEFVLRSKDLVRECGEYVRSGPQSKIEHMLSRSTRDESSRGKAHGDRVIAIGLALQLAKERHDTVSLSEPAGPPPPNTMAWREKKNQPKSESEWDDRTNWDFAFQGSLSGFLD